MFLFADSNLPLLSFLGEGRCHRHLLIGVEEVEQLQTLSVLSLLVFFFFVFWSFFSFHLFDTTRRSRIAAADIQKRGAILPHGPASTKVSHFEALPQSLRVSDCFLLLRAVASQPP